MLEAEDFSADYDLFDTFEGYMWHRFEHLDAEHRQFYLSQQAEKEFGQLRNVTFDIDIVHVRGEKETMFKPRYPVSQLYPEQNVPPLRPASGSYEETLPVYEPNFKKDMTEVAANAFRPGYSVRSFKDMVMFDHRDDNVARLIEQVSYKTTAKDVDFNVAFNINQVEFTSRLNSHFQAALANGGRQEDLVAALRRDYAVSKRQYAIYLVDCYDETLRALCASAEIGRMQTAVNNWLSDQMFVGVVLEEAAT